MAAEKGQSFLLKAPATGIAATMSDITNLVTIVAHNLSAGSPVIFTTTGVLPTLAAGVFTPGQVYYAGTILANTFSLHLTKAAGIAGTGIIDFTNTGSGVHTGQAMIVVAGMRTTGFTLNGEETEITTKDSVGWRDLLAEAGVTNMSISAAGVFQDDSNIIEMRVKSITKVLDTYTITFESGDEYYGLFQVTSIEHAGEHNGEVTYSLTLESSGVVNIIDNV